MKYIHLNKDQTDLLDWTSKDDPNDIIIINEAGKIIERRPMLAMIPQEDGTYIDIRVWYEVNLNGGWVLKQD